MGSFSGLDYLQMLDAIAPSWSTGEAAPLPDLPRTHDDDLRTPDDLDDILYASGTTGSPKGVMVTHDAVLCTAYASALTRAFEDGRRIVFSLPCYHMFGHVEGLLAAMVVEGAIIPLTRLSATGYFAAIERHRATDMLCVPTMTVALLEAEDREQHDLSSLFACLSGATPAPVWVWNRIAEELGTEVTTGYGMTECTGAMTLTLPEDTVERHATTVGRPKMAAAAGIPDADGDLVVYRAVDPIDGTPDAPQPPGEPGEPISTGPTHMLGFWDKPEETALAFRGGWVFSGVLGLIGEDGYVRLTGRSKELYKSGGELVMPKEVEDLLSGHSGGSQAFAIGVADDRWGELGCAWIVREPGSDVSAEELRQLCRDHLARFKVPKHILFIEDAHVPTTVTGNIQKFRLVDEANEQLRGATA